MDGSVAPPEVFHGGVTQVWGTPGKMAVLSHSVQATVPGALR